MNPDAETVALAVTGLAACALVAGLLFFATCCAPPPLPPEPPIVMTVRCTALGAGR